MKIEGIEFLGVEISFYCEIPYKNGNVNLGAVRLECEERSFVLDTVETKWSNDDGGTLLSIKIEAGIDGSTDDCESNFDLTALDLFSGNVKGTLWIEEEIEDKTGHTVEPESISLFYRYGGENGTTRVIDLEKE